MGNKPCPACGSVTWWWNDGEVCSACQPHKDPLSEAGPVRSMRQGAGEEVQVVSAVPIVDQRKL